MQFRLKDKSIRLKFNLVLTAVFLATLGDIIKACRGLVWHWDLARVRAATQRARMVIKLLADIRLASRATRRGYACSELEVSVKTLARCPVCSCAGRYRSRLSGDMLT